MQNKTSANIIGPDLNEYRGEVNYSLLATKTNYCYLRGSGNGSGKFRADKKFIEYVQGLKSVGILTGAYHYAVPSYDLNTADAQCDSFIDILQQAYGQGNYGDLFPVIDIEAPVDKSISTDALLDWVDRFRKRFERKTRRKMMLYTGAFFIELYNNFYHSTKGFILSDMPLWIAMYPEFPSNPPFPKDQGGWTRWRMWQYTESGTIAGVNPPVDLNYGPTNLDLLTQPDKVRNFSAVGTGQNIRLNWTANQDADLGGYNIFLNSSYITTVGKGATSYTIELGRRPAPGEKFEVSIEAFDTDGDFSPERAKETVTFTRDSEEKEIILEFKENDRSYEEEEEDFIDYEELEENYKPRSTAFKDPVDRLINKFMFNNERQEVEAKKVRSCCVERLIPVEELYNNFLEKDNEFDDKAYLERLQEESAYKNYYGEEESEEEYEYIKVKKEKVCDCGDQSHDDPNNPYSKAQKRYSCSHEKKDLCCKGRSEDKKNCCEEKNQPSPCKEEQQSFIPEDASKGKVQESEDEVKFVYKENYEGDRRRSENRDHKNKDFKGKEGLKIEIGKLSEGQGDFSIYDIYLNKCDYGYEKKNKSKKLKDMDCEKDKKKKHHKHH